MYDVKPNLVIGFHGCERAVRDQLLMNPNDYKISQKPYDWLGHGRLLAYYFNNMKSKYEMLGKELPRNKDLRNDSYKDKILRELDCAAIEFMHSEILNQFKNERAMQGYSEYKLFDSTRGAFVEGGPAFDGAGLFEKSHIQICIRNPNCIQGFFIPRQEVDFPEWLEKMSLN